MYIPSHILRFASRQLFQLFSVLFFAALPVALANYVDEIGLADLRLELGAAIPTGAGIGVSQIEADGGAGLSYYPDSSSSEFTGKVLAAKSGASANSGHATAVASFYYGNSSSVSPGVATIDVYSANLWAFNDPTYGVLNTGTTQAPVIETQKVQNHSWIGTIDNGGTNDAELLKRFDFSIQRDDFLAAVGLNNGSASGVPALLANAYNAVSVGLTNGNHSTGASTVDAVGRVKPEIVAPMDATSYATPLVASSAAMLWQAAPVSGKHSLTMKALLLAGATKDQISGWNRTTTRPLDSHYGAGQLNIFHSYHILAAGQQVASDSVSASRSGWDYNLTTAATGHYYFDIPAGEDTTRFSAILTWNRRWNLTDPNPPADWRNRTSSVADLSLRIYSATGFIKGSLVDQSISSVDNVEHLYETALPPGRYVLEVSGQSNIPYGIAWEAVNSVSVAATVADAAERGLLPGTFTFTRSGSLVNPLTIAYAIGGTATLGVDYNAFPYSITIPANAASATITVTPVADALAEGDETVTITLASGLAATYADAHATVTIHDQPVDAWRASYFTAAELNDPLLGGDAGDFDQDGIPNLMEYALGLQPKVFNSNGLPVIVINAGGYPQLTFTKAAGVIGVNYVVEVSYDLVNWTAIGSPTVAMPSSETLTVASPSTLTDQPKQYLRLRVSRQ